MMKTELLYKSAEQEILRIHSTQKKISWRIKSNSSLIGKLAIASRNTLCYILNMKRYNLLDLYNEQLKNVSSLNKILGRAIIVSNEELNNLESRISNNYNNIVSKSKELSCIENEASMVSSELGKMQVQQGIAYYKGMQRKSCLESRLSKSRHRIEMIQEYLESKPREISLLETQHKMQYGSIAKCELVLLKSKHIESILSECLAGVKSIASKRDLLKHLGVAFSDVEDYVNYVTNYAATELLNSASGIADSSYRLELSTGNSSSHLSALESINEF